MVLYDAGDDGALDAEKLITFDNDILELEFSKRICSSVSEIGVEGSRGEFVVEISFVDRFEIMLRCTYRHGHSTPDLKLF